MKVHYTKYAQFIISACRDISLCHRLLLWCFLFEVFGFLWWIRILNVIHFSIVAVCFGIKSAKCLWCLQFSALFTPPPLHISQKGKSIRCESSMFSIHHSFAVSSFFFLFFRTSRVLSLLVHYLERLLFGLVTWPSKKAFCPHHRHSHLALMSNLALLVWTAPLQKHSFFRGYNEDSSQNRCKISQKRLSPSKKNCVICFVESPLKLMKNAFYFILKTHFVLKIFKFLSQRFGYLGHLVRYYNKAREIFFLKNYAENEAWRLVLDIFVFFFK